jgi:flagellar FliL protein
MAAKKPAAPANDEDDAKEGKPGEGGEGVDLPKKKVSGKKLALIIVAVVVLMVGGGVAALYFTGKIGGHPAAEGEHAEAEGGGHGEGEGEGEATGPVFAEMPQILINLNTTGRRPTYLRLKVSLELMKEADRAKVTEAMPRVVDTFQLYLRELAIDELQGTAGIERLREELRLRVSAAISPVEIKDVLFSEMIIQSQ